MRITQPSGVFVSWERTMPKRIAIELFLVGLLASLGLWLWGTYGWGERHSIWESLFVGMVVPVCVVFRSNYRPPKSEADSDPGQISN
jgi:hypothetical protein